jgi:hypothetical protein
MSSIELAIDFICRYSLMAATEALEKRVVLTEAETAQINEDLKAKKGAREIVEESASRHARADQERNQRR